MRVRDLVYILYKLFMGLVFDVALRQVVMDPTPQELEMPTLKALVVVVKDEAHTLSRHCELWVKR